jgi:hypothetical protein
MNTFIKHALAILLLCTTARVSANFVWVPGTATGAKIEYVTLNTNNYAIDTLSFPWQEKTRVEFGFTFDTTTYFILPGQFDAHRERSMEEYRTLREAMINNIPVNIQVDSDTRDLFQIRLGITDRPLAIWGPSGRGNPGAEDRAPRIDLLGRNRKSAPGFTWQGLKSY